MYNYLICFTFTPTVNANIHAYIRHSLVRRSEEVKWGQESQGHAWVKMEDNLKK
jgi:hypothetical protein